MTNSNRSPTPNTIPSNDRILRWPEVHQRVGICRSHAHQLVAQGEFPEPIKLGPRASGWLESEINEWLVRRVAESRTDQLRKAGS
ncbi:MAG: AlpA family transcriptional regulator [Porticoccaceae bacterium]